MSHKIFTLSINNISRCQKVAGVGWQLAWSQSNWKPLKSDEEPTAKRVRNINRKVEKNCKEVLETSHTRLRQKLYVAMPRRIEAVIQTQGGHTKYLFA